MSAVTSRVVLLVGLSLLLLLGMQAMDAGHTAAGNRTEIANETWNGTGGEVVSLNHSNLADPVRYDDEVAVYNDSNPADGDRMSEPTDYTWFESNGTIKVNATNSNLTNGKNNSIYYNFTQWDQEQDATMTIVEHMMNQDWLIFLGAIAVIVAGLRVLGGAA